MSQPATDLSPAEGTGLLGRLWDMPTVVWLLAPAFWTGNIVLARAFHESLPPVALTFTRWSLALLVLLPFAWRKLPGQWPILRRHWRLVILLGGFGIAGYNALIYAALQSAPAVNVTLINGTIPVVIPLAAFAILREVPPPRVLAGLLLSLLGALWIMAHGDPASLLALDLGTGSILTLIAVANWSIYSVIIRLRPAGADTVVLLAASIATGLVWLTPALVWEIGTGNTMSITLGSTAIVAYLAVFASLLAFLAWGRSVELIGSTRTGLGLHLLLITVPTLGWMFLGEPVETHHLVGAALLMSGLGVAGVFRR